MTASELTTRLNSLGVTSGEIAASLRAMNVVGILHSPCACPIARFTASLDPGSTCIAGLQYISLTRLVLDTLTYSYDYDVATPEPVSRFMKDFDNRQYPDLIDPAYKPVVTDDW